MSSSSSNNQYPLARIRQSQIAITALAFPYSLAAIFTSHAVPETAILLIVLVNSGAVATLQLLLSRRKNRSKKLYPLFETVLDGFFGLALLVVFIACTILVSTRDSYWPYGGRRASQFLPEATASFACLLESILHACAFFKAVYYHRFTLYSLFKRKPRQHPKSVVTFVTCPHCSRCATLVEGEAGREEEEEESSSRMNWRHQAQRETGPSDVESRPLLLGGEGGEGCGLSDGRPSTDLLRYSEDTLAGTVTTDDNSGDKYHDVVEGKGR